MHNARIKNSPRLKKVLAVLEQGGKFSTLQIVQATNNCVVGTTISELRAEGYIVSCERNGDIWHYELLGRPGEN